MRTIAVVTVARSDYGIYLPVLREIQARRDLRLQIIAGGMHLSPAFGMTVGVIESDGFDVTERVEMLMSSDSPLGVSTSAGLGVIGFANAYARCRPDLLVVLGDRFEMHAAAVAALPLRIPLAHIHGGEITEGAIDDALRHSITKLSHIHFVSTEEHRRRVMQIGEEPWRVTVSGAPSLDYLDSFTPLGAEELGSRLGVRFDRSPVLVTYHPATLDGDPALECTELLEALRDYPAPVVFTGPNADAGGHAITAMIREFVASRPDAWLVTNAGITAYFSLMAHAAVMVGNSSSGLIEAPSFGLPAVNVGLRQAGRTRGANVIDVAAERDAIRAGINRALDPAFKASLAGQQNPYGRRDAAATIVHVLGTIPLNERLLQKRFCDWPAPDAVRDAIGIET